MKYFPTLLPVILIILISFLTVKPLVQKGFYNMHDDTQPSRIFEMAKSLKEGQFPVRLVSDLGYGFGYPIFNFYAPLPYYIGASLYLTGFDILLSAKLMFGLAIVLSAVSMYLLVLEFSNPILALLSSVLYIFVPYRALDLYVRGDAGELYALIFLPLLGLGLWKLFQGKHYWGIINCSIGLAGILLSHNISGYISLFFISIGLIFLLIVLFLKKKNISIFFIILISLGIGIGLSAFFTIPALVEKKYTNVEELTKEGSDYRSHFVYPDQLWNSPWGFGGSAIGRNDGMSFKIGKVHIIVSLLSLLMILILKLKKRIKPGHLIFFSGVLFYSVFSIFLMLEQSGIVWQTIPGFNFIQYPWRFIVFVVFGFSILPSLALLYLNKRLMMILSVLIMVLNIYISMKYFVPQKIEPMDPQKYISQRNLKYDISKISDEFLPDNFIIPKSGYEIAQNNLPDSQNLTILDRKESTIMKKYLILAQNSQEVTANIAFFPGWQATTDGKKSNISESDGRIKITIPQGMHRIEFIFGDTWIRNVSNGISIFSLFLLVYISLFYPKFSKCLKKLKLKL